MLNFIIIYIILVVGSASVKKFIEPKETCKSLLLNFGAGYLILGMIIYFFSII